MEPSPPQRLLLVLLLLAVLFCYDDAANPPSHPFSCDGKHSNKSSFGWFPLLVPADDGG